MTADMITNDDLNTELCTVSGVAHDWRTHNYTRPNSKTGLSWRCVWCHVVACGDCGEYDPCWLPYHHTTAHLSRNGVSWPLGGNRP